VHDIVITGMGVVTAAGTGCKDFAAALRSGRSGIGQVPPDCRLGIDVGALLTDIHLEDDLRCIEDLPADLFTRARRAAHRAPFSAQVSVIGAAQAWCGAGLHRSRVDPSRVGLTVAGQNLNQRLGYDLQQRYGERLAYLPPSYGRHFLDTDQVGILSEILEIRGEGLTVGGASASGNVGLIQGSRLIGSGAAEVCVVVGAMMDLSPLELHALDAMGALCSKASRPAGEVCRPFDRDRGGFVYGQGSGCLVLESRSSAEERGVEPLAALVGCALNLDGNRSTDPNPTGQATAMRQALRNARLSVADLDYINTHGTGSVLGDESELQAIKAVLDSQVARTWLNSTKSLVGHCLTAAGAIEAIATILQMRGKFLHPNLNLDHPIDAGCRFVGAGGASPVTVKTALSNSFGFGGICSSIAFRSEGG
jgi:malonyl-ACP decarboxylase